MSSFLQAGELAQLAPAAASAYFLDVDGTLLEIKPRPQDVSADAPLRELLSRLAAGLNGALALVSGRAVDDLDQIFAPCSFPSAGLHGAEIRFADGARSRAESAVMDAARPELRLFAQTHPGLMLEDKGATLALHYRQRPELADEVRAALEKFARRPGLAVQEGKMVAELKQAQYEKGTAIEALLAARPFCGRTPVFIGDDLTDESGFDFVNRAGGVTIRVGAVGPTAARFFLSDPLAVRTQLRHVAATLDA
ncbi:trehalose-phosphatase [Methylocapsa palsarum]|uniref:trehalose-phosphatase n=1 Tax=Methylocapsa palsarum TaxID=1612308 RepID=UPI001FCE1B1D|nr:trehalose-phosphatase [Methylocapsa palsarum]